jgi:hypothetical protein
MRQIEANRRNAGKSTGPKSEEGRQRSRCNAVRHGLTAETVIAALEDSEDYKAFEEAVAADHVAQTAVERELVLRLAGLLWRLRRSTAIETGLLSIHRELVNAHGLDDTTPKAALDTTSHLNSTHNSAGINEELAHLTGSAGMKPPCGDRSDSY